MSTKEMKKETSELLITVSAKKEEWKKEQEKAFNSLAKDLQVSGFRKGKAPADIARKNISQPDIFSKAIIKMLDILVKDAAKELKDELILDSPTYSIVKISDTDLDVQFIYPVYPEFKMKEYKNLDVEYKIEKVPADVIDKELKNLQERHSVIGVKDGKIVKGDTANFDFEGSVDGEVFDGGTAEGYELEIGSGQFIPGFEDQMIGLSKGDKKDIKVTFPKEYHVDTLKGKESVFKVVINEVKGKDVPELNDDLIVEANVPNIKTLVEFKKYVKEVFGEQAKQNARKTFQIAAFAEIKKDLKIGIPQSLVAKEMQSIARQFEEEIKKQGFDIAKYMEMTKMTPEQMQSQHRSQAEERLANSLIFAEIAKLEKIELTDADYDEEYIKLAKVYGNTVEGIKGTVTKEQMQIPMTNDRVIDVLIGKK